MENLIKELERMSDDANKHATKELKEYNVIGAAMQQGYSTGLQFAINAIKAQIALNGENKWKT